MKPVKGPPHRLAPLTTRRRCVPQYLLRTVSRASPNRLAAASIIMEDVWRGWQTLRTALQN